MHTHIETNRAAQIFDVREYGAQGDGVTLDTSALQQALDACGEAGGGRVALFKGTFLSGTLHLRSNVELHLGPKAVLLGVPDKDLYSGPYDDDSRWLHAFLLGEDVENLSFTGEGAIDGNNVFDPQGEEEMRGPHMVLLRRCRNVTLLDLTLQHAANYAFFFYASQGVRLENATFKGGWDGVHFRDLKDKWNHDVRITNCRFFTGDDAIAGACIEDAYIENCLINSSCNGLRLIGPARRWFMRHCRFQGPGLYPHRLHNRFNMLVALNIQPGAWGPWPGPLEELHFCDIEMERVQCAFHIVTREGNTGHRITLERIQAALAGPGEAASSLESWTDLPLSEIVCRDVSILASGGADASSTQLPVRLPGVGVRPLPVWELYAYHVEALQLEHIELSLRTPDARPSLRLDDVSPT